MVRRFFRLIWLLSEIGVAMACWCALAVREGRNPEPNWRAGWLQRHARRFLAVVGVDWKLSGRAPVGGLLVSNHLGYLDILVIGAVVPATFVSRADVRGWPVFGRLARMAGTVFLDRDRRGDVYRVTDAMRAALEVGRVVVIFPEGTSSDGQGVLPFHSSLFASVVGLNCDITVASVDYTLTDGSVSREVCYWGDMVFAPHLLNLLGKPVIRASLVMEPWQGGPPADRKALARGLREAIVRLRNQQLTAELPIQEPAKRPTETVRAG